MHRKDSKTSIWLLASITLSGTLAMHIFVPALPLVAQDMKTTSAVAQLTLSFYIIGLALAQLVHGPLSDRFGRRPILIIGLIIYTVSGLVAWVAPNIEILICARLFQAVGGCAGLVLGRAIVRDVSSGKDTAKELSLLNLLTMAGPGLAPVIGAFLANEAGWRAVLAALCCFGFFNLVLALFILHETLEERAENVTYAVRNYLVLLRNRSFLFLAIGGACATTSLYAFVAAAPFIFITQLHQPLEEIGYYLALIFLGVWFGNLTARRLVENLAIGKIAIFGNFLACIGGAFYLGCTLVGHMTLTTTLAPIVLLCFGAGMASPMAITQALLAADAAAGSASGFYGFVQMLIGAICTFVVGFGSNPDVAAGMVLFGATLVAQACFSFRRTVAE